MCWAFSASWTWLLAAFLTGCSSPKCSKHGCVPDGERLKDAASDVSPWKDYSGYIKEDDEHLWAACSFLWQPCALNLTPTGKLSIQNLFILSNFHRTETFFIFQVTWTYSGLHRFGYIVHHKGQTLTFMANNLSSMWQMFQAAEWH